MIRKSILLLILSILLCVLTSCWDRQELDELAVVVGMAVDKADDEYELSFQIVNAGEVNAQLNPSGASPVTTRSETGKTIYEANRKTSMVTPKRIYVSHLRVLVISEVVAREGITDILDLVSRDRDFRGDFIVIIAKDTKAIDTLKILTTLEKIPANQLFESLKTSHKVWAESVNIDFKKLMKTATVPGNSIVLSGIEVKGDKDIGETKQNIEASDAPAKLAYTGVSVFDKTKLIGWLTPEESKGYSYITDQIKNTVEHITCKDDKNMTLEIMDSKTKLISSINKHNKPKITVKLRTRANVGESNCTMELTNPKSISKIETLLKQEIKDIIEATITKVQKKYKVDIFGFGQEIKANLPKEWKKIEDDWDKHFTELDVEIKMDVEITKLGTTGDAIRDQLKE